jgi:hypothetical protein
MGILDDAIREHIDLKRRRGADPTEVERAEREALGPVRRNREAAEAPELAADPEAEAVFAKDEAGFAYDQEGEEGWTYDSSDDPRSASTSIEDAPPLEFADHDLAEPESPPASRTPAPVQAPPESVPPVHQIPPDDGLGDLGAPEPFPADPPRDHRDSMGGETAEYDVEQALGAEGEKDDDVLEETPEFLQETPDHDRLWFEQRPPRDFDFDG